MADDGVFDSRRKAVEEEYFNRKNTEALKKLAESIQGAKKKCPISGDDLVPEAFNGVVIYRSPSTQGVWIESEDLKNLLQSKQDDGHAKWNLNFFQKLAEDSKTFKKHGALKVAELDEAIRLSPASGKPMEKIDVSGVILDRCPVTGGLWFDLGELNIFVEKIESSEEYGGISGFINNMFKSLGYVS